MQQNRKIWRYIYSGRGSAGWNMAVDEALLYGFKEGDMPILRLYEWEPSLSFGRFSKPYDSIDIDRTEQEDISCVRRMTGGGILVHGGDLSYAMILPRTFVKELGVKESYRYLCRFLICLYEKLGLTAGFARDLQLREIRSSICLSGNEAYDIVIEGHKMGGNAQRYISEAIFQHGSIPVTLDENLFKPLFLEDSGLERAATLQRLDVAVTHEVLNMLLKEVFCETFNADVVNDSLHPQEEEHARRLLKEKYMKETWTFHADNATA